MHGTITLALLEAAPDRDTAQVMLIAAVHEGVPPAQMRRSWRRWERNHGQAILRGEVQ